MASPLRLHWPAVLVSALILAIFGAALFLSEDSRFSDVFQLLAGVVPTLVALFQYVYNRVERWRLWVDRLRLRAGNAESQWAVRVEFAVQDARAARDQVESLLNGGGRSGAEARLLAGEGRARVWLWRGETVRLLVTAAPEPLDEGYQEVLILEIPSVRTAYRSLERWIRDDFGSLLAALERDLGCNSAKYTVGVGFASGNPYFGLFVSNVSQSVVSRFEIDLREVEPATGERDVVRIRRDRIDLVTATAHSAERLSLRYLALRPAAGEVNASVL